MAFHFSHFCFCYVTLNSTEFSYMYSTSPREVSSCVEKSLKGIIKVTNKTKHQDFPLPFLCSCSIQNMWMDAVHKLLQRYATVIYTVKCSVVTALLKGTFLAFWRAQPQNQNLPQQKNGITWHRSRWCSSEKWIPHWRLVAGCFTHCFEWCFVVSHVRGWSDEKKVLLCVFTSDHPFPPSSVTGRLHCHAIIPPLSSALH